MVIVGHWNFIFPKLFQNWDFQTEILYFWKKISDKKRVFQQAIIYGAPYHDTIEENEHTLSFNC